MHHKYQESILHEGKCTICKKDQISHGPQAKCEVCGKTGLCEVGEGNKLNCLDCLVKAGEIEQAKHGQQRVDASRAISESMRVDQRIRVSSDIFNAKTIAINELKIAIDNDPAITEKHFTLAKALDARFTYLKEIIFLKRAEVNEAETEQQAINVYYNELAKRLRTEERERIKLQDTTYQPKEPTKVNVRKAPKVLKYDKIGVAKAAEASGIAENIIQVTCIVHNCEPLEAVRIVQKGLEELAAKKAAIENEAKQ